MEKSLHFSWTNKDRTLENTFWEDTYGTAREKTDYSHALLFDIVEHVCDNTDNDLNTVAALQCCTVLNAQIKSVNLIAYIWKCQHFSERETDHL